MHGLGNDFVLINGFAEQLPSDLPALARTLCHRQMGVGADGLIIVLPSAIADLRMRIFNADGSEPEMCGNGIRCLARYAFEHGLADGCKLTVETLAGIIRPELLLADGRVTAVRVDMGEPRLKPQEIPALFPGEQVVARPIQVGDQEVLVTAVSMGNPHCVVFVPDTASAPALQLGPQLETHPLFPAKTNVEFIQVLNRGEARMRVWERGVGETLACGTGACAAAVACALNGLTDRSVTIHLPGGKLELEWTTDNHLMLTGPAVTVFTGRLCGDNLR